MAWTEDRVELLKKLWAEGLSASQIASKMGGVTRNAVIGKVHRLGLSGRATPAKPKRGCVPQGTAKLAKKTFGIQDEDKEKVLFNEPEFSEPLVLDSGDMTTVSTLKNNMCKWPIGDPSTDDFHFCGQSTSQGKSYCAYHAHMAFQPSQKRERPVRQQVSLPAAKTRVAG